MVHILNGYMYTSKLLHAHHETYTLQCLADADPRVTIIPANAWLWDSYKSLEALGHLNDVAKLNWNSGGQVSSFHT